MDGEYVHRGEILLYYPEEVRFVQDKGSALFLHLGIDGVGTGFSAEFRRLERMEFRINNQLIEDQASLNYLPALTKQHKYTLAGLYPYLVQSFGEIGGQIDFFHGLCAAACIGHELVDDAFHLLKVAHHRVARIVRQIS